MMNMTLRCPCGCEINGNGDGERSRNFREHLVKEHDQDPDSLRMLEIREKLGEEVTKGLLAMEMEMRAHLYPSTRSREEILADSVRECGGVCVTEFSMSRDQLEDYIHTITCPACGIKVGGDDDGQLSDALREHCNGHEELRSKMAMRVLPGPRR
jgi:hypothetical protein